MDLRDMIKLNNQLGKDLIVDGLLYFIDDDKVCVEVCDMQIERADILKGTEIITDCAFKSCKNLVTVNIPEGVTDIQDNAFYGCKSLKKDRFTKWGINNRGSCISWLYTLIKCKDDR